MEEKFHVVGRALPWLVSLAALTAAASACSSEGSTFGTGGASNSGTGQMPGAGSGNTQPTAGAQNTSGSNTGPSGGSGPSGGNGNTSGSSNPGGGSGGGSVAGSGGAGPQAGSGNTAGSGGGAPPAEPCPKPEGQICHEFFANDNARNQLNYVNEFAPTKNWVKKVDDTGVNSPRQVEMVDNAMATNGKAIMISIDHGYQEYDMITGERLANVRPAGVSGVRGAVRLANGNTILGVGDDKLRTINASGATVGTECTLPGAGGDSLRVINRDPATGHLMLGRLLDLFIVNEQCQQQWTAKLPGGSKAYSVLVRPEGGVWATSGAPSTVIAYNAQSQIVGQVGGKDAHSGLGLDFFSGFELLPNGNIVAANWQGHLASPGQNTPHLVEFTPDNKLVWQWGNQDLARQITNTLMLR